MPTQVASLFGKVTANTDDAQRNLSGVQRDLEKTGEKFDETGKRSEQSMERAGESSRTAGISIKELTTAVGGLTVALTGAAVASRKAFQFAEEGAQLNQLRESFETTAVSIDELRQAARGTVSDADLMAQSMNLLTGTSGDLKTELSAAMPELLEIARASNKLNPTLGDTASLFESIAEGVKRGSALRIDNAGIILSQAEASERYADKLGISTDELTEQEAKIALLHETLRQGEIIQQQATETVEDQTEAYVQLRTNVENLTASFKMATADGAAPFVGILADMTGKINEADRMVEDANLAVALLTGNYVLLAEGAARGGKEIGLANEAIEAGKSASSDYADAMMGVNRESGKATTAIANAGQAAADSRMNFLDAAAALSEMSEKMMIQTRMEALKEAGLDAAALADAQEALLRQFGLLTDAEVSASESLSTLDKMYRDGEISAAAYASAISSIKRNIDSLEDKKITIDVDFNVADLRLPSAISGEAIGSPRPEMMAEGGYLPSGGTALVGEREMEAIRARPAGGVDVIPLRGSGRSRGGGTSRGSGDVIININGGDLGEVRRVVEGVLIEKGVVSYHGLRG